MENKSLKRPRGPNYTEREKQFLINIIFQYKDIIENKKTDSVSIQLKEKIWKKIETEFNAGSPALINRTSDSLKKYYENRKKELRKEKAQEKMEAYRTGGGPCKKPPNMESSDEVLLAMINDKTVTGLTNIFDGDRGESGNLDFDISIPSSSANPEVELSYEFDRNQDTSEDGLGKNQNSTEEDTTENHSLTKNEQWETYTPADLRQGANRILSFQSPNKENILNDDESVPKRRKLQNTSRRRPATVIRTLTSSNVAEKYDKLLDQRLTLSKYEQIRTKNKIEYEKEEHKLRKEALQLDILIKKRAA